MLASAAVLWYTQAFDAKDKTQFPQKDTDQCLRQALAAAPDTANALENAIQALEALMDHPELGGPGFLLVQFPADKKKAVVMAQYPNLRDGLYHRIIRQELDGLDVIGVPKALLDQDPVFEAESGGMVLITVQGGDILPELRESLRDYKMRNAVLSALAEILEKRFPALSVRIFGMDLLLSPVREDPDKSSSAVISIDK